MKRRAGQVTEITVFATEITVTEQEIFSIYMDTLARIPGLSMTKHFQLRMDCKVTDKVTDKSPFGHFSSR